jgi:hypothetical protein
LEECKVWKDGIRLLNGAVIGIPLKLGYGCPDCSFSQERARNITAHVTSVHGRRDNIIPIQCSIQRLFVSNLHGWWRVNMEPVIDETTDEGLLALCHFNAEFDLLEQQNGDSDVGIHFMLVVHYLSNSHCTCGSTT